MIALGLLILFGLAVQALILYGIILAVLYLRRKLKEGK